MENYVLIGSILLIHVLAWFTPGPQIVLIMRNSLVYSRKTGFWTAVGFALGNFIHIILAVAGIGIIISGWPIAFSLIKFLGAGYLIYLGLKTFFTKAQLQKPQTREKHRDIASISALRTGLITNLLSPKASPFFITIFGTLLASKPPYWVVMFLMIAMPLNTLMMASMWSLFFAHQNIKAVYARFQSISNKCLGGLLILLALMIVFSKK